MLDITANCRQNYFKYVLEVVRFSKLMQITAETISSVAKRGGRYCVPDRIRISIEQCLESDDENAITSEYRNLRDEFLKYRKLDKPALIDYRGALTLDAYTAYYLPRYMFIPSIALRDLTLHPLFQNVADSLNVLDLGSGTGAVVLGLLSMFSKSPLSQVSVNITALDSCAEALDRQKDLIDRAGYNSRQVHHYEEDLCDIDSCMKRATKEGPYNLIFLANCLTEIPPDEVKNLVEHLPDILADNGAIIIAEAQRDYTKKLVRTLATMADSLGLNVFYPCAVSGCPYSPWCWVWRYHEYDFPSIKVSGQLLQEDPRDELILSWLILSRQKINIYDTFNEERPDLSWGAISKENSNGRSICSGNQQLPLNRYEKLPLGKRRGWIVGLNDEGEVEDFVEM